MEKGMHIRLYFFHCSLFDSLGENISLYTGKWPWRRRCNAALAARRPPRSEVTCARPLSSLPPRVGRKSGGPADDGCRSGQHAKPTGLFFFFFLLSLIVAPALGSACCTPPFRSPHRPPAGSAGSNGCAAGTGWRGIPRLPQTKKFEACVAPLGSLSLSLSLSREEEYHPTACWLRSP